MRTYIKPAVTMAAYLHHPMPKVPPPPPAHVRQFKSTTRIGSPMISRAPDLTSPPAYTVVPRPMDRHAEAKMVLNYGPLFETGGPKKEDVNQGATGDCYLLATLAAIAEKQPHLIESMIMPVDRTNTEYDVLFHLPNRGHQENPLRLSLRVFSTNYLSPELEPVYAHNKEGHHSHWVTLLEHWFAKVNDRLEFFGRGTGYDGIGHGGVPHVPYYLITGRSMTMGTTSSGMSRFREALKTADDGGIVVVGTNPDVQSKKLVGSHAYTVVSTSPSGAQLYNPWGETVELSWAELYRNIGAYWVGD